MTTMATDEQIQQLAATAQTFSIAILSWAEGRYQDGADAIELEHQRRMIGMHADGTIAVLCPVPAGPLAGVAVMTKPLEEATEIMAADPCVQAGMMTVEVHACLGFPGDSLPG